jgi:hypothetical protein
MSNTNVILDPTAAPAAAAAQGAWRLDRLEGKVVGFVDNAKPNFGALVDELSEVLVERYGVARIVKTRKRAASVPAEAAALDALAAECDLVITGSGD